MGKTDICKLIATGQSADQALTTMITYNYEKATGSDITPIDWTRTPANLMSYDTFHSQKRAAMIKLTDGSLGFIANHFRRQMQTTKERIEMDKKEINEATGLMNEQGEYQEYRDRFVRRSFSRTETPTYAKLVAAGHRPVRALEIMIQYNYGQATGSEITPIDWTPAELMPRHSPMTGNDFASEKRQAISDIMNQRGNEEILRKIQIIKEIKSKPWYHKDRSWGEFAKSFVKGTRKKYRRTRRSRRSH